MFLAIGNSTNYEHDAFSLVREELIGLGSDATLFCQDKCLEGSYITFDVRDGQPVFLVTVNGSNRSVSEFEGIWYLKPHLPEPLREHPNHEHRAFIERQFRALRKSIQIAFRGKRWLNDPQAAELAENKPWQLSVSAQLGLTVPDTIITSDPGAALEFIDRAEGETVIKMLATSPMPNRVIYTNRIDSAAKSQLDRLRFSPAIIQRAVEKAYEVRATIVGDEVFAARIDSQDNEETSLDWRKVPKLNDFDVGVSKIGLPEEVTRSLRRYLDALGLRYGAIDLVVTPQGEHVFLKVNPNGQWCFVQKRTGHKIAGAIARLLLK